MQVVVVLDVIVMAEVEFLGVQLDAIVLVWRVISTALQQVFEVLTTESHHFFGLLTNYFFDEVLEDAWEGIWHINLLSCENSHLSNV